MREERMHFYSSKCLNSKHSNEPLAVHRVHVARYAVAGEKAVKVQHVIHVPPPPPAPPGCADLDSHCAQVRRICDCRILLSPCLAGRVLLLPSPGANSRQLLKAVAHARGDNSIASRLLITLVIRTRVKKGFFWVQTG